MLLNVMHSYATLLNNVVYLSFSTFPIYFELLAPKKALLLEIIQKRTIRFIHSAP